MNSLKDIGNLGNVKIRPKPKTQQRPNAPKRKSCVKLTENSQNSLDPQGSDYGKNKVEK